MRVAIACPRPFQKLPHLLELLQQPVDFLYGPPRALRDPQPPRPAEDRRIGPLVGRHGQHDCLDVLEAIVLSMTPDERADPRSEEHTSELQSRLHLVCRLLLLKKKKKNVHTTLFVY